MKKVYIFLAILLALISFSFRSLVNAAKPSDFGLKEGDLISAIFSSDPDVYIINEHGYKRLFLNPEIFKFYTHLGGFANVKLVTPEIRDAFPTVGLFRNCEKKDLKVYGFESDDEDEGKLRWVNTSGEQAVKDDPDFFKKVFCINDKEFKWYKKGSELKAVVEVPQYQRAVPATPATPASPSYPFSPTASTSQPAMPNPASGSLPLTPASVSVSQTAPVAQPVTPATPAVPATPATPAQPSSSTLTPTPIPTPTPTPTPSTSSGCAPLLFEPTPTPPPSSDTTIPSAPTNLSAKATVPYQIDLTWTVSADNVAVTCYRVFNALPNSPVLYPVSSSDAAIGNYMVTVDASSCSTTCSVSITEYGRNPYINPIISANYSGIGVMAYDAAWNRSPRSNLVSASVISGSDAKPPVVSSLLVSSITTDSAVITWKTDEPAIVDLSYGIHRMEISTKRTTVFATSHSATLSNLSSGTNYKFGIYVSDTFGNQVALGNSYWVEEYNNPINPNYVFTTLSDGSPTPTPSPTGSVSFDPFSRDLAIGSRGDDVKHLQALLVNEVSYPAHLITGYFGSITREAVKRLQGKYHITPALGYFGQITKQKLQALYLWR